MIWYLDTSAAMKLLVEEPESESLAAYLRSADKEGRLVASWLLHTELHRAAHRHPLDLDLGSIGVVLDTVSLIDVTRGDLLTAGNLPAQLRSNDAIHLAVALRVGADEMITYDTELAGASNAAGVIAVGPS